jgi:hypothetical protein
METIISYFKLTKKNMNSPNFAASKCPSTRWLDRVILPYSVSIRQL